MTIRRLTKSWHQIEDVLSVGSCEAGNGGPGLRLWAAHETRQILVDPLGIGVIQVMDMLVAAGVMEVLSVSNGEPCNAGPAV